MITLTDEIIKEGFNEIKVSKSISKQSRKTHLILSDRSILKLNFTKTYDTLEVIDLRKNKIYEIQNLANMSNITHLYLQNNDIKTLSGFPTLARLKVLFLDFNKIQVIENLDACPLMKLSIKGQRLERSVVLGFDPLCMKKLKGCLLELIVSNNKLSTIRGLSYLKNLEMLDLSGNKITELNCFSKELSALENLQHLNIRNNPIMKNAACLAKTVSSCKKIKFLNEIPISSQTRIYCAHMYKLYKKKPEQNLPEVLISAANKSSSNFPVSLRPHLTEKLLNEIRKKLESQKK